MQVTISKKQQHYKSKLFIYHGDSSQTEQQEIKGLKFTRVKTFKHENKCRNLYEKREMRNNEPYKRLTPTKQYV